MISSGRKGLVMSAYWHNGSGIPVHGIMRTNIVSEELSMLYKRHGPSHKFRTVVTSCEMRLSGMKQGKEPKMHHFRSGARSSKAFLYDRSALTRRNLLLCAVSRVL